MNIDIVDIVDIGDIGDIVEGIFLGAKIIF